MFNVKAVTVVDQECANGNYGVTTEYNVTIATIYAAKDLKRVRAHPTTFLDSLDSAILWINHDTLTTCNPGPLQDQECLRAWSDTLALLTVDGVPFTAHVVCLNNCKMGLETGTSTSELRVSTVKGQLY